MPVWKRRQFFVDRQVQGELMLRTVMYWFFCLISVAMMLLCWRVVTSEPMSFTGHVQAMWYQFAPAILTSLILVPIVVVDSLKFSNRFAGPVLRLRGTITRLADGERVEPVNFRENDYWREFAEEFNRMIARVQGDAPEATDEAPAAEVAEEEVEAEPVASA